MPIKKLAKTKKTPVRKKTKKTLKKKKLTKIKTNNISRRNRPLKSALKKSKRTKKKKSVRWSRKLRVVKKIPHRSEYPKGYFNGY